MRGEQLQEAGLRAHTQLLQQPLPALQEGFVAGIRHDGGRGLFC